MTCLAPARLRTTSHCSGLASLLERFFERMQADAAVRKVLKEEGIE
jgi:hypothetical protein